MYGVLFDKAVQLLDTDRIIIHNQRRHCSIKDESVVGFIEAEIRGVCSEIVCTIASIPTCLR